MTTMADLKPGTRIRHLEWELAGTIRVLGGTHEIRWDETFGDYEISDEGPVFPSDVEIIEEGPVAGCEDDYWPDGMQPDTGEECFTCGAPCGRKGGRLCDPRCTDCNPGSGEA